MTLRISPAHEDLLVELRYQRAPFVIVGATALHHHVALARTTDDLDLAVVADEGEIAPLLHAKGWKRDHRHPFRWTREESVLDVVPATPTNVAQGHIVVGGDRDFSLVGFDLALEHSVAVPLRGGDVRIAALPAIVVLKMVAWLDRPHERRKDLGDLARVLDKALDDFDERRWEPPLVDVEVDAQCAFFVGREVAGIAKPAHAREVVRFLDAMATSTWTATFADAGDYLTEDPEAMAARRLAAFRRGFNP